MISEELVDLAARRPRGDPEPSARPRQTRASSDADRLVVGREDRPDGRGHDVEALVTVGQRLGVADLEGHVEPALGRLPPRGLDEHG